jgi:carbonic anhydrase
MIQKSFAVLSLLLCGMSALCALDITPDAALARLKEGSARFVNNTPQHADLTAERYDKMKASQEPFATIVGCSDSRVPPELIFDQGLGDLFVVRVAGNVVGPIELDTIEYGVFRLHTPLILVLGHENCGAVKAALALKEGQKSPDIQHIYPLIEPALTNLTGQGNQLLEQAVKKNVMHNVDVIKKDPRIAQLIKEGKLQVLGGYYDLVDYRITLLHN